MFIVLYVYIGVLVYWYWPKVWIHFSTHNKSQAALINFEISALKYQW